MPFSNTSCVRSIALALWSLTVWYVRLSSWSFRCRMKTLKSIKLANSANLLSLPKKLLGFRYLAVAESYFYIKMIISCFLHCCRAR